FPAGGSVALGALLRLVFRPRTPTVAQAMLLCGLAWFLLSAVGAMPFVISGTTDFLDGYFETVSGFTTTGITMITGLDGLPHSIIFWRALTQWVGGLGILTFFLGVTAEVPGAYNLYGAETHKIDSGRPVPGMAHTVRILWLIYTAFTLGIALLLRLCGVSLFDGVCHAFTALSTGGFSPYDASIAHYANTGLAHFRALEYVLILGMFLGGTSFVVHYSVLSGKPLSLFRGLEMRLWWSLLVGFTALILVERWASGAMGGLEAEVRTTLFQVVSITTTTGFGTRDIGSPYFGGLARLLFLAMMVTGGCVGSTGGGIKVLRVGILYRQLKQELERIFLPRRAVKRTVVDGGLLDPAEAHRVSSLLFGWMVLLLAGAGVTAVLSDYGPLQSASGMFSALGNIGPCYIPVAEMGGLDPLIKVVYIFGMVAGRLEILPVLLLFSRRAWRS
ncbi:MAG: TrkH family potassium uptake protein, partial [Candidatus Fermentibacteraceae bacterium]